MPDEVERWAAEARALHAADARSRERWLRRQAEEGATLAGAVVDLTERRVPVVIVTTTGRRHAGTLTGVGEDFVAVRTSPSHTALVAMAAVSAVHPTPHGHVAAVPVTGADDPREALLDVMLSDVLAQAAGHRPRVQVHFQGGSEPVAGELHAVGVDVLTLRTAPPFAGFAYLRLASVSEISLLDSG